MTFAQYYIFAALVAPPMARIFMRFGMKTWWAALLAAPDVGLTLCILALAARGGRAA